MQSVMRSWIQLVLLLAGIACSYSAQAAYTFRIIQYPGAAVTQFWGINNSGQIVGEAYTDAAEVTPPINFVYDLTSGVFTNLPSYSGERTGMTGINDARETVGSAFPPPVPPPVTGVILDTKGKFATFSHPAPSPNTFVRAVNNPGLVTGYAQDNNLDNYVGFIYDPTHGVYTDLPFVGSTQVIAQGITTSGEVVGSVRLPDQGMYSHYPTGRYGFLRDTYGTITLFQINSFDTRARGINDLGLITGFFVDASGDINGFVGTLPGLSFQTLIVPGASDTFAQAINNSGQIVGYTDSEGFIASLIATDKDQCKGGGWQSFSRADGTFFKNQGDCIQYVNTGK
jgi:hypothetical protein